MESVDDDDPEILYGYTIQNTQSFLHYDKNNLIQKVVSNVGHLIYKCGTITAGIRKYKSIIK